MIRVLIVEDSAADAEILADAITEAMPDAVLAFANDGDVALALITSRHFDIVFLDLNMPRMTGAEVLEELSTSPSGLGRFPIIITTTDTTSVKKVFSRFAFKVGIYLVKPLDVAKYGEAVRWVLQAVKHFTNVPLPVLKASYEQA